jgi:hypothetical protein
MSNGSGHFRGIKRLCAPSRSAVFRTSQAITVANYCIASVLITVTLIKGFWSQNNHNGIRMRGQ